MGEETSNKMDEEEERLLMQEIEKNITQPVSNDYKQSVFTVRFAIKPEVQYWATIGSCFIWMIYGILPILFNDQTCVQLGFFHTMSSVLCLGFSILLLTYLRHKDIPTLPFGLRIFLVFGCLSGALGGLFIQYSPAFNLQRNCCYGYVVASSIWDIICAVIIAASLILQRVPITRPSRKDTVLLDNM